MSRRAKNPCRTCKVHYNWGGGGGGQKIADCISGSREATNMKNCSTHILWTPKVTVCSKVLHYGTAKVFVLVHVGDSAC